jgi:hypothetical protein
VYGAVATKSDAVKRTMLPPTVTPADAPPFPADDEPAAPAAPPAPPLPAAGPGPPPVEGPVGSQVEQSV